jgi:Spy/CpxP family protein refolding chaperone
LKKKEEYPMKRTFFKLTIILSLSLLFLDAFSAPAFSQNRGPMMRGYMHGRGSSQGMMDRIDLSEEQSQQIRMHCDMRRQERNEIENRIVQKRIELRDLLEKKEIDKKAIDATVQDLKNLYAEMLEHRVDEILKLRAILTPEQFEKLKYLSTEESERRGPRKGGFRE